MVNLSNYIKQYDVDLLEISKFLVNNNWFNVVPISENGSIYIDESGFEKIRKKIDLFCMNNSKTEEEKTRLLLDMLDKELPESKKILEHFYIQKECNSHITYIFTDFILYNLAGELTSAVDKEIQDLLDCACKELSKGYCDILCDFLLWAKENYHVSYQNVYKMNQSSQTNNDAYSEKEYLNIMYKLFNSEYIESNNMYENAAESKNFTDTWLFLSLHFVCSLRNTDLLLLPHPKLTLPPETVIKQVKEGSFSETDARAILYSIIYSLRYSPRKPNKTKNTSYVSNIKFFIPESVEIHFGTLFALAEAHFQVTNSQGNLIRNISRYEQISRYMGDDIGELFLYSDFKARAANKSYLQMIEVLTDDINGNDNNKINGYMLAALARSHKGGFGEFASTTAIYLKDAKTNGFTPEFVAKELFERGPLSFIVSKLLSAITDGKYDELSFSNQTKFINIVNLTPNEVENAVGTTQSLIKNTKEIVKELYKEDVDIKKILHRIASKEINSKDSNGLCLMHALGKVCPFVNTNNCINCDYEIGTKYTLIILISEYKRLLIEYKKSNEMLEKEKNKYLATNIILPKIQEMLDCMEKQYGKGSIVALEKMLEVI